MIEVGQYGQYKGKWYIVVDVREDRLLILGESNQDKKQISPKNFVVREGNKAKQIWYQGTAYLITKTKRIISLLSFKYMNWHENSAVRKSILAMTPIESCKNILMNSQSKLPL